MTQPPAERPPQRLSPLTPVVRGFIVLVAAAWTVFRDVASGRIGPTASLFALLLVGGAVYGAASWLRTTFWIEADELRVDTGVISRQSRRIRIDRLQGVDIVQPFVARLFGLAELRMDVAGGSNREGSLAYLPLAEANRLRDVLLTRRDQLGAPGAPGRVPVAGEARAVGRPSGLGWPEASTAPASGLGWPAPPGPAEAAAQPGAAAAPAMAAPERVIARIELPMLLKSIVWSAETLVLLVVLLGMGVGFGVAGEWLGLGAILPVLLGFGVSMFRRFSQNYSFTVSETPAGLQVRRGLFDLSSQTIALHRVQGVVVTEPLLWRPLGWARLDVSIAGYGAGVDPDSPAPPTAVLPVGDRAVVHALARHVLRGLEPQRVGLRPVPRRARWFVPVGYRYLGAGTDEDLVVTREGWVARRTHAVPQARAQSVRLTQGPWQRRLGLADVHVDSPPGPVTARARHRDAAEARRLFDVEVATTSWARRTRG